MFRAAVGHGIDPDSIGAIEEALEQCAETLVGDVPQAGIVISAIDFEHEEIIRYIRERYPEIVLIGGTSAGEMSSAMAFQEDSLVLMLFCSDEVSFGVGAGYSANEDATTSAKSAIAEATSGEDPLALKLCYSLGEGLGVDGVAMVEGLKAATGHNVPIVGGLTGEDWQFKDTYQFISTPDKTEVLRNAIVVLTLVGELKVSYAVATGLRPVGPKGKVTNSVSSTLYEIDQKPARKFYEQTFGERDVKIAGGGAWGGAIAVYEPDETDFYVRSPNGDGHVNGSIDYFGHVTEQSTVQLTEADSESLLTAAKDAFQKAQAAYPGEKPEAALMVSCASRLKSLGTRVGEEYRLAEDCLGQALPSMGFYAYGEISPFTGKTDAHFHNETFTALLIGTR